MENRSREYRKCQWIQTCAKRHPPKLFDYSLAVYVDGYTKVEIVCQKGHHFWQTPHSHRVRGCPICKGEKSKSLIFGKGINDLCNHSHLQSYIVWHSMLRRCYSSVYKKKFTAYSNVTVCKEWLTFFNFKKWFEENYVEGYALDKDILVKNNRIYSPDTCCFVPNKINLVLTKRKRCRGNLPIGVSYHRNRYSATLHLYGKQKHLGYFDTPEEAFNVYKKEKERHLKELAKKYFKQGAITEKVFNALINYRIEIND